MHVTLDEFSAAAADEKRKAVEQIVATNGGQLIPASYPRAHRARPFTSLFAQPWKPERTVPTHGLCPHSRALEVARDVYDYFETQATLTQKYGITWSLISSTVGTTATLIEPLICYPDPRGAHYARNLEPEKKLRRFGESDPAVIEAVRAIRKGVVGIFLRHGCAHLQIGKAYPYREGRDSATWALMQAIKSAVDPCGLLNPGSLGL